MRLSLQNNRVVILQESTQFGVVLPAYFRFLGFSLSRFGFSGKGVMVTIMTETENPKMPKKNQKINVY